MVTVHDRLKMVVLYADVNQAEFAKSIDIGQPHLSAILSPRLRRNPSKRLLRRVSEKYGIDYEWLITGNDEEIIFSNSPVNGGSNTIDDPPELQQVIKEARSIWPKLELDERYELAAILLKDISKSKRTASNGDGNKAS